MTDRCLHLYHAPMLGVNSSFFIIFLDVPLGRVYAVAALMEFIVESRVFELALTSIV